MALAPETAPPVGRDAAIGLPPAPLPAALRERPDFAAAWPFMCAPVQARYEAESAGSGPARRILRDTLVWLARRGNGPAPAGGVGKAGHPVNRTLSARARILVVQPDHLGGVIASSPVFQLLKDALPAAHVAALVGPWGADAAEHCPSVDRVLRCRFPAFERREAVQGLSARVRAKLAPYVLLRREAARLAREHFDVAVLLVPDSWATTLMALAGVPLRVGFETGEGATLLTHPVSHQSRPVGASARLVPGEPGTIAQLRLANEALGLAGVEAREHSETQAMPGAGAPAPSESRTVYEPTDAERLTADEVWQTHGLGEASPVVAIHPAPGGPSKRWPAASFAALADHLTERRGARVVLTGAPADVAEARAIAAACVRSPLVLAGQTSFGVLGALMDRCRLVVGTDNGAMHLATARGVPSLRLFGPTDQGVWGAWTAGDASPAVSLGSPRLCAPCHRLDIPDWRALPGTVGEVYPCMADVSVEAVIDAVESLWQATLG